MRSLSKQQEQEQVRHVLALATLQEELEAVVDAFNQELERQRSIIQLAIEKLNGAIQEAEAWREEIHADIEAYVEGRSEKWQESDAGRDYAAWQDDWNNVLEEASIELPDDLDPPEDNWSETVEQLPPAPGGL